MNELRQREPRVECPAFLAFVRRKPCVACGAPPPSQAAHLRMGSPEHGKRNAGIGEKPSDRWATPLCADCHLDSPDAQHRVGERTFWARAKLDPFKIAARLYAQFERRQKRTPEQREIVVQRAKRRAKNQGKAVADFGHALAIRLSKIKNPHTVVMPASSYAALRRPIPKRKNPWPPKGSRKIRSRR